MPPADHPPSSGPLTTNEQVQMLSDSEEKVSPSTFPVPTASPDYIEGLAEDLRTAGGSVADRGNDITSSWGGLTNCYKAPEADELYTVLGPVASDGDLVLEGMDQAATALETFAGTLRSIKSRWSTLRTEAYEFRARIDAKGEDWRDAEGLAGFFGIGDSPDVEKNKELIDRGTALIEEYEEAECDCANALNKYVPGRTRFEAMPEGGGDLDPNVFYHGYEQDLSELATEWGMSGATTDEHWWVDVGASVWDFGVGAVEGTGAMLGAHSSEGWFQMSWGDALLEYHEDNLQSTLSLVGMYDAESDSYGWAGLDTVGSAWKDLAHSVVPWEEWGERPGYVIGTALLNIGATVGGAVLTATGVGAVVGVPLMAWRGMAILDGMGGRGGGGSGGGSGTMPDLDTNLTVDIPRFGDQGSPVIDLDTARFADGGSGPGQLADANSALSRLLNASDSSSSGNGSPDAPRARPVSDTSDERSTTGSRSSRSEESGADPYAEDLLTVEDVLNPASPEATRLRDAYQGEFLEADSRGGGSSSEWEAGSGSGRDSSTGPEPNREPALVGGRPDTLTEQASSPSDRTQRADLSDSTGRSSDADRVGERDSRAGQDAPNGRDSGTERTRDGSAGGRGPDLRDDRPGATNRTDTTPSREGSDPKDRDASRDDSTDRRTKEKDSPRSDRGEGERSGSDRHGRDGDRPGQDGRRHPGLGPDDPDSPNTRRDGDGTDSDNRSRSDADAGRDGDGDKSRSDSDSPDTKREDPSTGTEEQPRGRNMTSEERFNAAQKYLKGQVWTSGKQFVTDFVKYINQHSGLFDIYYNKKDGHRWSIEAKIGDWIVPQIQKAANLKWIAKDKLPPPDRPKYLFPEKRRIFTRRENHPGNTNLDDLAENRLKKINDLKVAENEHRKILKEHKDAKHPKVLEADKKRSKIHGEMTRASEAYGEATAASYISDIFDGKTTYDIVKRYGGGEPVNGKMTLPEALGDNLLNKVDTAPGSGNFQFDQIHRTSDGGFVITEAKGDIKTKLGERKIGSGENERMISQGVYDYLQATFRDMRLRGAKDTRTEKELEEAGLINEGALARDLKKALREGKLYYAEIKGVTTEGGKHGGVTFGLFDVSEGELNKINEEKPEGNKNDKLPSPA